MALAPFLRPMCGQKRQINACIFSDKLSKTRVSIYLVTTRQIDSLELPIA